MRIDEIVQEIKQDEGFRGEPYDDHLGFPTIGYGTKLPLTKKEATVLLNVRLNEKVDLIAKEKPVLLQMPELAQQIIANMAYQMGVRGVLKFRKMWSALEEFEFSDAADEMLDSRWAAQTPRRAEKLAARMRSLT